MALAERVLVVGPSLALAATMAMASCCSGMEASSAGDGWAGTAGEVCERGAGSRDEGMELSLPTFDAGVTACAWG